DVEGAGGLDGACDGGGDVVEFEVEEDVLAALLESTDDVGPRGGEELGADLVPVDGGADALHQVERGPGIRQVEGDNDGRHRFVADGSGRRRGHGTPPAPMSSRMSATPARRP